VATFCLTTDTPLYFTPYITSSALSFLIPFDSNSALNNRYKHITFQEKIRNAKGRLVLRNSKACWGEKV